MQHVAVRPELNWAGNYAFTARRIHRPGSLDEVRRLVEASAKLRAVGTRHSFNGIADSAGDMVDLGGLAPELVIDRAGMTVSVGAGTSYAVLAAALHREGFALHNLASLPHISVAGAVATGTHGSGDGNAPLSGAVCGLELITADGSLLRVARGVDADFEAMVVGLGAFGIVTRVRLDIGPTFDVQQDAFVDLPWETLIAGFDALTSSAYSMSVMTKWSGATADQIWLKQRLGITPGARPMGLVPATPIEAEDPAGRLTPFGVPGPWSERLAHFRPEALPGEPDQIQSEYMIPRGRLADAIAAMQAMAGRIDPILRAAEIRTMAADAMWLSPAYEQASVGLHFTWHKQPAAIDAITRDIEAVLIPLGARPHWGKLIHAPAATLAPLYRRFEDFRARATWYDPQGKFRNAFMERHVFG